MSMRNRRGNNLAGLLGCLLALVATVQAAAQSVPQNLLAHGTGEMYWIAQVQSRRSGTKLDEYTIIRGRQVGGDARWPEIGRVPARVIALANRGAELAVLLESGDWMLLWPGGSAMGRSPQDGSRIVTMGGGPSSLWAIAVGGRQVSTTDESTTSPATHPAAAGLYMLEAGQLVRQSALPAAMNAPSIAAMSLAIVGGEPVLGARTDDSRVRMARWSDGKWESLGDVDAGDAVQMKLIGGMAAPVLWLAPASGPGRIHFYSEERWSDPRPLEVAGYTPASPERVLAAAAQNLRLAFIHDAKLVEQAFDPDGVPIGSAELLPTLQPSTEPAPLRWLYTSAAAMLMMVVIGSVRRGAPPDSIAGLTPAPLSYRFMAGMIDALPLAVAIILLSRDVQKPDPSVDELMTAVGYPFYISMGIYFLHTWLSEQFFSRTLGKLIFGLRVVTLDGTKPGFGPIFIRNLLRLVDVMIMVPLVLVLFSPLRQRVGDVAARTVVVIDGPAESNAEEPES
jgi:uncharacterized RDD family membrane protein YckC